MTIKAGDILFLDTNILLVATDAGRLEHATALALFTRAAELGIHLAINGQVIREYLVVATRPQELNGLGLSTKDVLSNIARIRECTIFYDECEAVTGALLSLVHKHRLKGKRIHDANIAATMISHNIEQLLTLNPKDFKPFQSIRLISIKQIESSL